MVGYNIMQFPEANNLGCPSGKCPVPCNLCTNLSCANNTNPQKGLGLININMRSSILPIAIVGLVAYIIFNRRR